MKKEKKLFELCCSLGEGMHGKIHVLDNTESPVDSYRVYHADGYCWDASREQCEPDSTTEFEDVDENGYCYQFSEQWAGFTETGIDTAIKEIEKIALTSEQSSE